MLKADYYRFTPKGGKGGVHSLAPQLRALSHSGFIRGQSRLAPPKAYLITKRKGGEAMADDKKNKHQKLDNDLAALDADYAKLKADLAKFRADCEEIGPREI